MTSQISIAANQGAINWDDLNWERSYDGMRAYSQSKIAFGLFGLELDRRSEAARLGHHEQPLAPGHRARRACSPRGPSWGATTTRAACGMIRWAVGPRAPRRHARDGGAAGALRRDLAGRRWAVGSTARRGSGHLGGAPAEQKIYSRLRDADSARRIWEISEQLTAAAFPLH